MKTHKIIDNYCRLYGKAMPIIDRRETRYFVTISHDGAGVLYLRQPSKLLGRIVGTAMKRGSVLYVDNGRVTLLTWEKWKLTWKRHFAPKVRDNKPEPNKVHPFKSEIFDTMQHPRATPKPQKHGFRRTFAANQSMELLASPLSRMQVERL